LNLYDEGFRGLNAASLIVSSTDRHLNEKGTEVVAKSLFSRLKLLREYRHLTSSEAFLI
jgi:hypothetical protein